MKIDEVIRIIKKIGVISAVRANSAEEAMVAVEAIKVGGVLILEITMTIPVQI
jgi:2-dehydro-3-deoxyphosphogluconate aldolase / (4S)-4-hydroxy-2-oxoglutarate aldolase